MSEDTGNGTAAVSEGNLSEVRQEIQIALASFHAHVKYTITLMTTLIALALAIIAFGLQEREQHLPWLMWLAAALFITVPIASTWSKKICRRYYLIYACNYIYYARLHLRVMDQVKHPWVQDLMLNQGMSLDDIESDRAPDIFIDGERHPKDPNSWRYYRWILDSYAATGATAALGCALFAPRIASMAAAGLGS
jgi:hypothetical protein